MAYSTVAARQQLLDSLASAGEEIGFALACLGDAYEQLDEYAAQRLEAALFKPVQLAFGRARRTHTEFAQRHGLPSRPFEPRSSNVRANDSRGAIDTAVQAVASADDALATLQDSMLPVEVGDPELRAGLAEVRALVSGLPGQARELLRTLGR